MWVHRQPKLSVRVNIACDTILRDLQLAVNISHIRVTGKNLNGKISSKE